MCLFYSEAQNHLWRCCKFEILSAGFLLLKQRFTLFLKQFIAVCRTHCPAGETLVFYAIVCSPIKVYAKSTCILQQLSSNIMHSYTTTLWLNKASLQVVKLQTEAKHLWFAFVCLLFHELVTFDTKCLEKCVKSPLIVQLL